MIALATAQQDQDFGWDRQGAPWSAAAEALATRVLIATSDTTGVPIAQILGKCRQKEIATARHLAAYLIRHRLRVSYPAIAEMIGFRDHTSALHAVSKIHKYANDLPTRERDLFGVQLGVDTRKRIAAVDALLDNPEYLPASRPENEPDETGERR